MSDGRRRVRLVIGGDYHDFDYMRRVLLGFLAEHDIIRTSCVEDFSNAEALADGTDFLLTCTNSVIPTGDALAALERFLADGGRWLAIHGAAALMRFKPPPIELYGIKLPGLTDTPDLAPEYMNLLGARFIAHLAQQPFTVRPSGSRHPVVDGLPPFEVIDEPYIVELRGETEVLLESRFVGEAPGYVEGPWLEDRPRPMMTSHRHGRGEALYIAPGHACGRFDLRPMIDELPVQRGPWEHPVYRLLLRRAIAWGIGLDPVAIAAA